MRLLLHWLLNALALLGVAYLLPSVQVNMRAGQWPEPEANGTRYIKIPLNAV